MIALKTTFDAHAAADLRGTWELRLGEERFWVKVANGQLELRRGSIEQPDATLETDAATLRRLVFDSSAPSPRSPREGRSFPPAGNGVVVEGQLEAALAAGKVKVSGNRQALSHLLKLFPRSTPATV